jgi:hypothetical protein
MGQAKIDARELHEQLLALVEARSELTSSDQSSVSIFCMNMPLGLDTRIIKLKGLCLARETGEVNINTQPVLLKGLSSSTSFGLLPPCPQIFHGRETEIQDIVNTLMQDSACIAILGTGGMGKTSLATAALHNPQVEARYSHRYFVPCHSCPTSTELATTIADHIGLEKGRNMAGKIVDYFSHAPPSLLVLDNLETCWENLLHRAQVEEFLALVTAVPILL